MLNKELVTERNVCTGESWSLHKYEGSTFNPSRQFCRLLSGIKDIIHTVGGFLSYRYKCFTSMILSKNVVIVYIIVNKLTTSFQYYCVMTANLVNGSSSYVTVCSGSYLVACTTLSYYTFNEFPDLLRGSTFKTAFIQSCRSTHH